MCGYIRIFELFRNVWIQLYSFLVFSALEGGIWPNPRVRLALPRREWKPFTSIRTAQAQAPNLQLWTIQSLCAGTVPPSLPAMPAGWVVGPPWPATSIDFTHRALRALVSAEGTSEHLTGWRGETHHLHPSGGHTHPAIFSPQLER